MSYLQLIINPGSTSTKLAYYRDKDMAAQENIPHDPSVLQQFKTTVDQIPFRMEVIRSFMERHPMEGESLSAVVARGGLLAGLKTGGYLVNDDI